ncbi:MAG TPA: helix-hairpin-helix domain-containing protein [Acidobacteriaceae bacterium]|nr:helix-hairpin-helix domain-containing protein [Acidobacteriaceae bacterium]
MHLQKRLSHILCGAGLIVALSAMPATWGLSPTGQVKNGPSASPATKMGPMDINTASVNQLRTLPGVGDTYAQRIVSGRPYSSKNQLVSKGILPRNVYNKIQDMIVASHVRK